MTPLPQDLLPHEAPPPSGRPAALADAFQALVPTIETARTRLRAPRIEDFGAWAAILCSPRAVHMGGPYARDDAFDEFASYVAGWLLRGFGPWTVEARDGAEVLGFVHVGFEPSDHEPELGWLFLPAVEGRGLALEASEAARDWARVQLIPSLVSYVGPENDRSQRLARRLGADRDPAAEAAFAGTPDADTAVFRHWGRA